MKLLSVVFPLGLLAVVTIWLNRRKRSDVSPEWLIDHRRRQWGSGIDQSVTRFPINKVANDNGWRNRYLLSRDREAMRKQA